MSSQILGSSPEELVSREWIALNHLGGYASSTPGGLNTRKYHGLLVAAMLPPARRMVLLSRVEETVHAHQSTFALGMAEYPQAIHPNGLQRLVAFDASPYPRWAFQGDGWTLQKELLLLPNQNAVCLRYTLLGCTSTVTLVCRPLLAMRGIHELMFQWNGGLEAVSLERGQLRVAATSRTPEIYFAHDGRFDAHPLWYLDNIYRQEERRGYAALEDLWTPGTLQWSLSPGRPVHLVCATEPMSLEQAMGEADGSPIVIDEPAACEGGGAAAKVAAVMTAEMAALADAATRYVPVTAAGGARLITEYPWPAANGRDTLIALPGLFLCARRFEEAATLLDGLIAELRGGLMPGVYPEDGSAPQYNSADSSLWFIHAIDRYFHASGEDCSARIEWIEAADRIIDALHRGTPQMASLGISVDAEGLICTHSPGVASSWMDAKCGDWIVTPRFGRRVEMNALWHNALCVTADLMRRLGRVARAEELAVWAGAVRNAFVRHFWDERRRCCHDVVADHVIDRSVRPNQLLAISLPHPVLASEYQLPVLNTVRNQLLTPMGLRSLSPDDPAYCGRYRGDVVARDRAQHQGSVYPWLLGPYADALLRVHGDTPETRQRIEQSLAGCIDHLRGVGLGHLPELFDGDGSDDAAGEATDDVAGEKPRCAGGAIASARSLGEVLRAARVASSTAATSAPVGDAPATR